MRGFRIQLGSNNSIIVAISCDCGSQAMTEVDLSNKSEVGDRPTIGYVIQVNGCASLVKKICVGCSSEYLIENRAGIVTVESITKSKEVKQ